MYQPDQLLLRTCHNSDSIVESWKTSQQGKWISELVHVEIHRLLAKGLWKYVDRSAMLTEGATAEQQAKHQSEPQKASSTIAMSVTASQLYLITSYEEPKEAWDVLKHLYSG